MTKLEFIDAITKLKRIMDDNKVIGNALNIVFDGGAGSFLGEGRAIDLIIELLEQETGDSETKWIQYYVYEIKFGAIDGGIHDKEMKAIPLTTTEDLWNILIPIKTTHLPLPT